MNTTIKLMYAVSSSDPTSTIVALHSNRDITVRPWSSERLTLDLGFPIDSSKAPESIISLAINHHNLSISRMKDPCAGINEIHIVVCNSSDDPVSLQSGSLLGMIATTHKCYK